MLPPHIDDLRWVGNFYPTKEETRLSTVTNVVGCKVVI